MTGRIPGEELFDGIPQDDRRSSDALLSRECSAHKFAAMSPVQQLRHVEGHGAVKYSRIVPSRDGVEGQRADVRHELRQQDLNAVGPRENVQLVGLRAKNVPGFVHVKKLLQARGHVTERRKFFGLVGHDASPSIVAVDVPPSTASDPIVGEAPGAPASPAVDAPGVPSALIALRFALLTAMVAGGIAVAVTGRWNGVAILQLLFLLGFFATYQNIRAAVAEALGVAR